MHMRALPSVALAAPRDPAPARLVAIAPGLSAVLFDAPAHPGRAERLSATVDGLAPPRPSLSTSLELRTGRRRHVLLLGLDAQSVPGRRVLLRAGAAAAAIDPDWLRSPLARPAALTGGLTSAGSNRLTRLILSACAALPGGMAGRERLAAVLDLIEAPRIPCRLRLPLGATGSFLVYRLPGAPSAEELGDLIPAGTGREPRIARHVETRGDGVDLFLFVPGRIPEQGLICLGARQLLLAAPDPAMPPRPIVSFLGRVPESARDWAEAIIAAEAAADPSARAALAELRHAGPAPEARLLHLSATRGGVLVALDLADPEGLVAGARIERDGAETLLASQPGETRIAGFAPLAGTGPVAVRLLHRSGRLRLIRNGPAPAYRGETPEGFRAVEAAAVARARTGIARAGSPARLRDAGAAPARPRFSLVAPVSANPDIVLARAAILAATPGGARVETVYHAAEGPAASAAAEAAAAAAAIFGAPIRLVTLPAGASASECLGAALGHCRAGRIALLGAEVMPEEGRADWLGTWSRGLGGDAPRLRAGILATPEGAILAAGGADLVGLPLRLLPARLPAPRAFRAEAALLNRAAAERLADLTSAYPNPDILLALLAARLGAAGHPARMAPEARFIRYAECPRAHPLEAAIDAAAQDWAAAGGTEGGDWA